MRRYIAILFSTLIVLTACKRGNAPMSSAPFDSIIIDDSGKSVIDDNVPYESVTPYIEKDPKKHYTERELQKIMDYMDAIVEKHTPASEVIVGYGIGDGCINIDMIWNSEENRDKVRKYLVDGDFLKFNGDSTLRKCDITAVEEAQDVRLVTKQKVYPSSVKRFEFDIVNHGTASITCGNESYIAFIHSDGTWRFLPLCNSWVDIAHTVKPAESHHHSINLSPQAFATPRSRYRIFYPFYNGSGDKIWLVKEIEVR